MRAALSPHLSSSERKALNLLALVGGIYAAVTSVGLTVTIVIAAIGDPDAEWVLHPMGVWLVAVVLTAAACAVLGVRLAARGRRGMREPAPIGLRLWVVTAAYFVWLAVASPYGAILGLFGLVYVLFGLLCLFVAWRVVVAARALIDSAG